MTAIPQPRISLLLPTVKCSTCGILVPVNDLGEHVCQAPPPLPISKPSVITNNVNLLPQRLQGLVSPGPNPSPGLKSPMKSSPLRSNSPATRDILPPVREGTSPLRTRSNSSASTPSTARPPQTFPPKQSPAPLPPQEPAGWIPQVRAPPPQLEIDTKTGGEAGMAGVGRRGFAAAAKAALLITSPGGRAGPPPPDDSYNYPDRSTPSFPSASTSSPLSSYPSSINNRTPSPLAPPRNEYSAASYPRDRSLSNSPSTPYSAGGINNQNSASSNTANGVGTNGALPSANPLGRNMTDAHARSPSVTSASRSRPFKEIERQRQQQLATKSSAISARSSSRASSSSGSEYGLAYAQSTDYEDDEDDIDRNLRGRLNTGDTDADLGSSLPQKKKPPPLSLDTSTGGLPSILNKAVQPPANGGGGKVTFPPTSSLRRPSPTRAKSNTGHRKNVSTESSGSDRESKDKDTSYGRDRSNSALIARSLGLAQTPPSSYAKIGGPGAGTPTRTRSGKLRETNGADPGQNGRSSVKSSRSASESVSSNSGSSGASASMYSRTTSASALAGRLNDVDFDDMDTPIGKTGRLERAMETLLEDVQQTEQAINGIDNGATASGSRGSAGTSLTKSKSTGRQRTFGMAPNGPVGPRASTSSKGSIGSNRELGIGAATMRSNTIQTTRSRSKSPEAMRERERMKLPRSRTEREPPSRKVGLGTASEDEERGFRPPPPIRDRDAMSERGDVRPKVNTSARRERDEKSVSPSTSPTTTQAKRPKICIRCEKKIENGRWVAVDIDSKKGTRGKDVLCERCWKNMYLPKCRRCNLPIEKQAVSSSDGQLKGKYHPECFNCATCFKPFPDKSFYVYDGKPLCAYHYHEANSSLCCSPSCGQPIEGPCAVSHMGDRFHPEHFLCEYSGCREKLLEYFEVDGKMLCERHAGLVGGTLNGVDDDDDIARWDDRRGGSRGERERERRGAPSTRAMKRVTRFIDLAGAAQGR